MPKYEASQFEDVRAEELANIQLRRANLGIKTKGKSCAPSLTGIAMSGGGIRSASFCLGVMQSFYRRGVLKYADYMSSVSGGGYTLSLLATDQSPEDPGSQGSSTQAPKRLAIAPQANGSQSEVVRRLARSAKIIRRPLRFLSKHFWGLVAINTVVLSGLVCVCALMAWVVRWFDGERQISFLQELGFGTDVSRALFPAFLCFVCWLLAMAFTSVLGVLGRSDKRPLLDFCQPIYVTGILFFALGVVTVLATEDVSVLKLEKVFGVSPGVSAAMQSLLNLTSKLTLISFVLAIAPYLRLSSLIRSGTRPSNMAERVIFKVASNALVLGTPLLVFYVLAHENVSGYHNTRANRFELSRGSIRRWDEFWHQIEGYSVSTQRKVVKSQDVTPKSLLREIIQNGSNDSLTEPPLGHDERAATLIWALANRVELYRGLDGLAEEAIPTTSTSEGATSANGRDPQLYPIQRILGLEAEIDERDERTWFPQRWISCSLAFISRFPEYYEQRERLAVWKKKTVDCMNKSVMANPYLFDGPKAVNDRTDNVATHYLFKILEADNPQTDNNELDFATEEEKTQVSHRRMLKRKMRRLQNQAWNEVQRIVGSNRLSQRLAGAKAMVNWNEEPNGTKDTNKAWFLQPNTNTARDTPKLGAQVLCGAILRDELNYWSTLESELKSDLENPGKGDERQLRERHSKAERELFLIQGLVQEIEETNWRLMMSYFGPNVRPPETIFALVVAASDQSRRLRIAGGAFLIFVIAGLLINLNSTSIHGFYREYLCKLWNVNTRDRELCSLKPWDHGAAIPIWNGTLNLFGKRNDPDVENMSIFSFTPMYCGAKRLGFRKTSGYFGGNVSVGDAMAISGAALTPSVADSLLLRVLLTLTNFRLGQWLPSPKYSTASQPWPSAVGCLSNILMRPSSERQYYLVTDGGHNENTGMAPLLQRRCRLIIGLDGSYDPDYEFVDLRRLIDRARWKYGIEITSVRLGPDGNYLPLELSRLRPSGKTSEATFVVGRIKYPDEGASKEDASVGYLVYIKPAFDGMEPAGLAQYRLSNMSFPHDSTVDQFFEPDRFEAYRHLGEHIGESVYRELWKEDRACANLFAWEPDHERAGAVEFHSLQDAIQGLAAETPVEKKEAGLAVARFTSSLPDQEARKLISRWANAASYSEETTVEETKPESAGRKRPR